MSPPYPLYLSGSLMARNLRRLLPRSSGPQPWRDMLIALFFKLGLLGVLYLLFFAPASRPPSDASTIAAALVGSRMPPYTR